MVTSAQTLALLQPELILVVTAATIFVGGAFRRSASTWTGVALAGFILAGVVCFQQRGMFIDEAVTNDGPLMVDALGQVMRSISLVLGALFVLSLSRGFDSSQGTEALGMLVLAVAGLLLVSWAGNLILLFLGLELISIPTYVLLFLGRRHRSAAEATAKYFFLSILSSAVFLFGLSILMGVTGSADLSVMRESFTGATDPLPAGYPLLALGVLFAFSGLGFKIAAVPFHFYAPDVYQATTNGNAGLLAVIPKLAGVVALIRLFVVLLPAGMSITWQLALLVSLITMTLGNVCALWQGNLRRMMAYSSIAHAGYMLIGLAAAAAQGSTESAVYGGFSATLLYLLVYAFASLGTFAVLCQISGVDESQQVQEVNHLRGLAARHPWMAGVLAICMFSLAGIPPLAGFWGKMTLFTGALAVAGDGVTANGGGWFIGLAVVGVLNAAIAAAYYLRVVGVSYFSQTEETTSRDTATEVGGGLPALAALLCAAVLVLVGVFPTGAVERFDAVSRSLIAPKLTPSAVAETQVVSAPAARRMVEP